MSTTINGVVRYAQNPYIATDAGSDNVMGEQATVMTSHPTLSGATVLGEVMAPRGGILKFVYINGSVTSDATKTYTLVITNVSKSKTMTAAGQVWDADPVLTAGTRSAATLSTTAADVAVDEGDLIQVSVAGGTGAGSAAVELVFEFDA